MKTILCYGDSNTYGLNPEWVHGNFGRHDINTRWTGRLQNQLGSEYRVIEEGLCGRNTSFEDPTSGYRNGLPYFQPCIESHAPLDLIIIMLGTNDCKGVLSASPADIAMGLSRLIQVAKNPALYMGAPVPKILIAVPVPIGEGATKLPMGMVDMLQVEKSRGLAAKYKMTAETYGCEYIDLGEYASTTEYEGIHLDVEAHAAVANALEKKVREILG